jgi:hypothetical protein
MTIFRNIANKAELARASAGEIQKLLTVASAIPHPDRRQDLMRSCVDSWTASFPRETASAALGVLEEGIRRKREQTVQSAGTDILAHQRLLTDFLHVTMCARQAVDPSSRSQNSRLRTGAGRDRSTER